MRILHEVLKTVPGKAHFGWRRTGALKQNASSRELGIAEHDALLGKQNGLPQILSSRCILASKPIESFGLAALETMSCGGTSRNNKRWRYS